RGHRIAALATAVGFGKAPRSSPRARGHRARAARELLKAVMLPLSAMRPSGQRGNPAGATWDQLLRLHVKGAENPFDLGCGVSKSRFNKSISAYRLSMKSGAAPAARKGSKHAFVDQKNSG